MNVRRVTEVGVLAEAAAGLPRRGRIAAVFERSFYAVFDDVWFCIGLRDIGSGPLNVLCEGIAPLRVAPGEEIAIVDATIFARDLIIAGLVVAPVWAPAPPPEWTQGSLLAGITAVDVVWRTMPEQGLSAAGYERASAPPSRVLAAAEPGLSALKRLIKGEPDGNSVAPREDLEVAKLIGLGPGLTPSGDDLLAGVLVALAELGFTKSRDKLWNACRGHLGRTNEISAAHLRGAARGYASSALHEAIHTTMGGRVDHVGHALTRLTQIGHSSGRDAFAGALIALRAATSRASR